ncbi:MAG TPA: porin family protein [Flavitalea sp.]|mgnify:CR=1 FL=1|nr:porin family protein [Flavitalea sp.]
MSDNKFEKQVQQKMDELKITPSGGTWEKIEAGIRSQRRRRFPIWLPALLLLAVGGSYFVYQALDNRSGPLNGSAVDLPSTAGDISDAVKESTGSVLEPAAGNDQAVALGDADNKEALIGDNLSVPGTKTMHAAERKGSDVREQAPVKKPSTDLFRSRRSEPSGQENNKADKVRRPIEDRDEQDPFNKATPLQPALDDTGNAGKGLSEENIAGIKENDKEAGEEEKIDAAAPLKEGFTLPSANEVDLAESDEKQMPSPMVNKNKRAGGNWQWGVSANAGMAFVSEGAGLHFDQVVVEDISMSAPPMMGPSFAPSPPSAIPGPSFTPSDPAAIRPGFAFTAGLVVKRKLSDKIFVSGGLSYAQYNTRARVGERVERSQIVNSGVMGYQNVGSYFLNARTHNYSNRYHFAELPLALHVKLNRSEKTPFYVNAGGYLGKLISSNNLHFDGTNAVYYKDESFLNKTQAGASAGFSVVAFNQRAASLWIGPSLRYSFSPLLKKSVSGSKRLVMPSLDIRLFFNK